MREATRLKTFLNNYLFAGGRTAQYHQLGNIEVSHAVKGSWQAVRTRIRLLAQPQSMRSIVGATHRE